MGKANKQENRKNGIMLIIILAVTFGMASGIVGELVARSYLSDYNTPFFGEINFSNENYGGAALIIRDAKKVIVEQDTKIVETINSANNSLVGIFKKQKIVLPSQGKHNSATGDEFNINNYYQINQETGHGFIITSDGWIITAANIDVLDDYVIITKDKKIYNINKIVRDSLTMFHFLHIAANDLPVKKFIPVNEISNGQLVLAVNWNGQSWSSRISDMRSAKRSLVNSSDIFFSRLNLVNNPPKEFNGSVLFNLSGDVIGLINDQGEIKLIYCFTSAVKSLLKYEEVRRASLGVNYIDLSQLVKAGATDLLRNGYDKGAIIYQDNKGIAVVKNSAADLAGLKEGDIIISADNIEINKGNNLTDVIQQFIAGDKVRIIYWRNGEKGEVEVELGEVRIKK
ncbi:MAG: PDZ domain-containing protein [Patescibacteria group bacterium]|nr:PDZ domain-containing protein [Patescibacteria group bacterium]